MQLTYLDDDLVWVEPLRLPLDVALDVVVAHLDGELNLVFHVDNATVWIVLGVNLAVEYLVRSENAFTRAFYSLKYVYTCVVCTENAFTRAFNPLKYHSTGSILCAYRCVMSVCFIWRFLCSFYSMKLILSCSLLMERYQHRIDSWLNTKLASFPLSSTDPVVVYIFLLKQHIPSGSLANTSSFVFLLFLKNGPFPASFSLFSSFQ